MTYVGCDEMSRMRQRDLSPYLLSPIFKSDIPGKRLRRKLLFLFCEKNSLNENIFLQNKNSVSGKIMNKETNILNNIRFEGIIEIKRFIQESHKRKEKKYEREIRENPKPGIRKNRMREKRGRAASCS